MLKQKFQYFSHLMQRVDSKEKTPMLGKTEGRRSGAAEDERIRQCHQLNGHESEQTLRDGERIGEPGMLQSMWSQRVGHDLASEQQQNIYNSIL